MVVMPNFDDFLAMVRLAQGKVGKMLQKLLPASVLLLDQLKAIGVPRSRFRSRRLC